jgi:hypothetical protein
MGKVIVMGMRERGGEIRAMTIPDNTTRTIQRMIREHVAPGAMLLTDSASAYVGMREYRHEAVNHAAGEFARGRFHTNGIEGFWSLFKRQYHGTHHWISPKHMNAYIGEMCFRQNRREMHKSLRIDAMLGRVEGRLTYKGLINAETKAAI